jgi:ribonucleoside-triphosphate reductase
MKDVKKKLTAADPQHQNANVDEKSFNGRKGEVTDLLMKKIALEDYMSETSRRNHIDNIIYIHDLTDYAVGSHNCLTIPFDKLFKEGFNTRQTDVRPPQSINTAFQLLAVIFQLQSLQQFGGVSASHLDWTMVPFVRKSFYKHYIDALAFIEDIDLEDEKENLLTKYQLPPYEAIDKFSIDDRKVYSCDKAYKYALKHTIKETEQAAESMYHNLNTLQSRAGNQLPFTSINYGTCTLTEGRMVTEALLHGSIKGVGKLHKTPVFPCGIFQCMIGVNRKPGDPNYDLFKLALRSTAKRLYPNYANVDWSTNAGYDKNDPKTFVSTMGKRKLSSFKISLTAPAGVAV